MKDIGNYATLKKKKTVDEIFGESTGCIQTYYRLGIYKITAEYPPLC